MDNVIDKINGLKTQILDTVTTSLHEVAELDSYEIAWKQMQDIAAKEIENIIKQNIPNCKIIIPKSKSTYPDVKIIVSDKQYAIDIKCAEKQKDPWFDMARMDTFIESRYNIYDEEWELLLQYDSQTKKFIKAYFGLFHEFVGKHSRVNGIKFRPYDGKIRPKTWSDFDDNVIYWQTKDDFLTGLKTSQIARWKSNISKYLIPLLSDEERNQFSDLFVNNAANVLKLNDDEE